MPWRAAILAGLVLGALSALGQAHLDGTLDAFANSLSTWLVAPFVVGTRASALVGGPVFAIAGRLRATAVLAGLFLAEGLYAFALEQHDYLTGALWIAIGVAIGHRQLRQLAVMAPLGLSGELVLTAVLRHL